MGLILKVFANIFILKIKQPIIFIPFYLFFGSSTREQSLHIIYPYIAACTNPQNTNRTYIS